MNRRTRIGYTLFAGEILLSGMLPVLGKLSYGSLTPIYTIAISTLIGSLFFAVVLTARRNWCNFLRKEVWASLIGMTLLIVVGFYGCMFTSLGMTSATNVAMLSRFEILMTILLIGIIGRHEHVTRTQILGAVVMLASVVMVLFAETTKPNIGDLIMLVGACFTPYGNLFQQRARAIISGEAVYFFRSFFGGLILLCIAALFEAAPAVADLNAALPFLLASGLLVFGLGKMLFVEALHRLKITIIIPLGAIGTIVTLIFAAALLGEQIRPFQIMALIPMFIGIWLLTRTRPDVVIED